MKTYYEITDITPNGAEFLLAKIPKQIQGVNSDINTQLLTKKIAYSGFFKKDIASLLCLFLYYAPQIEHFEIPQIGLGLLDLNKDDEKRFNAYYSKYQKPEMKTLSR